MICDEFDEFHFLRFLTRFEDFSKFADHDHQNIMPQMKIVYTRWAPGQNPTECDGCCRAAADALTRMHWVDTKRKDQETYKHQERYNAQETYKNQGT